MQINLCVVLELLKHRLVPLSYSPNLALFESLFLEYLQYFVRLTVSLVPHLAPLIQKFFCIPDGPQLAVSVLIDPVDCSFLSTFRSGSLIACLWSVRDLIVDFKRGSKSSLSFYYSPRTCLTFSPWFDVL